MLKKETSLGFVYFLYKKNEVVYVGITKNIHNRINQHKKTKDFSHYEYKVDEYEKCKKIEKDYIRKLKPKLNLVLFKEKIKNQRLKDKSKLDSNQLKLYDFLIYKRKIESLTQKELSQKVNVSRAFYNRMENYKPVSSFLIARLIEFYSLNEFLIINNTKTDYIGLVNILSDKCKLEFTQADWASLIDCSRAHFNKWVNQKIIDWQITFFVLRHFGMELTVDFYHGKYYERN